MKLVYTMMFVGCVFLGFATSGFTEDKKEAVDLGEVVISATKVEVPLMQVGSSVTVLTGDALSERQYRSVADALRDVPGVDSDHTLVMIDGIQVQDVSSPTGAAALDYLTVDNVDRIEVVRGPQSTLYGSDAIGGLINIITKTGEGRPSVSMLAEGGSYSTTTGQLNVRGGNQMMNYSVSLSRKGSRGISATATNDEDDPYRNTTISSRIGTDLSELFSMDLFFRYVNADVEIDSGADLSLSETNAKQLLLKAQPRLLLLDGFWEQKMGIWIHQIERENQGSGITLPSEFKGTLIGVDWQHNIYTQKNHTITLGMEFENQDAENEVGSLPQIEMDTHNLAVFVQDQVKIVNGFSGTVGFRADHHKDFGTEATYRITGAYELDEMDTLFRFSTGTGFKAPTLSELFDSSFGSNNPNLDPERSVGFDLGIEQSMMEKRFRAAATYFYNDIDDMIVAVFNGVSFQNVNIERVVTNGVELTFMAGPIKNIMTSLNYTYTDTEAKEAASFGISKGSRLLRRPLHRLSADIGYTFLDGRAEATLSLLYIGERDDLDPATFATVVADDYKVVNLRGSFSPHRHAKVFGRIENVLDEDYQEVLGFNTARISATGGVELAF
jgi:vitamin B12 transporter